ncbi:MAG: hypothetical protein LUQ40_01645 [Methanomicrobiales archaeon]|nr:hypothetical protein [Methanomicrobiales archaeon]
MKKQGEQKTKGRGAKETAAPQSSAKASAAKPISKDEIASFKDKSSVKKKKKR